MTESIFRDPANFPSVSITARGHARVNWFSRNDETMQS